MIFVEADILALLLYVSIVPSLVLALLFSLIGFRRGTDVCEFDVSFSNMTGCED